MVGVGTPQSCGLRKTALEFVQQDEPTDAGALGTRECVLFVLVTELAYVLGSNPRFCGFDSRPGHHRKQDGRKRAESPHYPGNRNAVKNS